MKITETNKLINEEFDDSIDLDMETDFDDDEVHVGDTFIESGDEYVWKKGFLDYDIHLDFDHWQIWSAKNTETDEVKYFIVDPDNSFIDWGPMDTLDEAKEFYQSKIDDYEDEDEEDIEEGYDEKLENSEDFNQMSDIDILYKLYQDASDADLSSEIDNILIKNGSDPHSDTWDKGLDTRAALKDITEFLKKEFSNRNEVPVFSYEYLGLKDRAYERDLAKLKQSYGMFENKSTIPDNMFTVELYTTHEGDPVRTRFPTYKKAMQFAKTEQIKNKYSDIIINKRSVNGPSTQNSWTKADGWFEAPAALTEDHKFDQFTDTISIGTKFGTADGSNTCEVEDIFCNVDFDGKHVVPLFTCNMNGVKKSTVSERSILNMLAKPDVEIYDTNVVEENWVDDKMAELQKKPKDQWTEEDWDAYNYCKNTTAEADYYDSLDEKLIVEAASLEDMKNNPIFKVMSGICDTYSVQLRYAYLERYKAGGKLYLNIQFDFRNAGRYFPEVFYHDSTDLSKPRYQIQTGAYGALTLDEYEKFLKSCNDAYNMVKELSAVDTDKLYIVEPDEQ